MAGLSWLAVLFALASAGTAALSTATQHYVAGATPAGSGPLILLRHLIGNPLWLGALCLGPIGFAFHAIALHHGPIALVQPLAITGLVFAVPIRAAWSRSWPSRRELRAVAVTAMALAVLLLASQPAPSGGREIDDSALLMSVVGCAVVVAAAIAISSQFADGVSRSFILGGAAGVLFGLMAVLLRASTTFLSDHGVIALAATWLPWTLVVAGVGGVAVNQLAYRCARLSASMPALNAVNCLLALALGHVVLGETPPLTTGSIMAGLAAIGALSYGLWQLARVEELAPQAPQRSNDLVARP